jgi:hypothetical protein
MDVRRFAAAGVVVLALVAGCSDSDPDSTASPSPSTDGSATGASVAVCDAAEGVRSSFQTVVDDVRARNFGDAKTSASQVGTELAGLATAVDDLADEKQAAIEPDLETARDAIGSLSDAGSLADITAALGTARTSVDSALSTVGETEDCP